MIEFGKTLREAREAKGLTVAQLAEMTHMTVSRVEELETENFANIPAAIYGRGFVRLYCGAVGLDPKPLSDEFTEIFSGNRDTEIRERAPAPAAESTAGTEEGESLAQSRGDAERMAEDGLTRRHGGTETERTADDGLTRRYGSTETEPISDVPPPRMKGLTRSRGDAETVSQDDLFADPTPTPTSVSPCLRVSQTTGNGNGGIGDAALPPRDGRGASPMRPLSSSVGRGLQSPPASEEPAAARGPALSRYAAPLRDRPKLAVPPAVWRFALLGCAALLVLWALAVGVRALYRATGGAPAEAAPSAEAAPTTEATATPPPAETKADAKAAAKPATSAKKPAPSRAAAEHRTPQAIPSLYID